MRHDTAIRGRCTLTGRLRTPTNDEPVETVQRTLEDHLTAALEHADDDTARFHLRHARQVVIDLPTVVEERATAGADSEQEAEVGAGTGTGT